MNGKRFFTVLIATSALVLFSSFAFGQIVNPKLPAPVPWDDVVRYVFFQVDEAVVQADSLQNVVETEISDKNCCEGKRAIYKESLASIQEAWNHIAIAYHANNDATKTHDGGKLALALSELSRAAYELNKAFNQYCEARRYNC
jgi:hypothetical protein